VLELRRCPLALREVVRHLDIGRRSLLGEVVRHLTIGRRLFPLRELHLEGHLDELDLAALLASPAGKNLRSLTLRGWASSADIPADVEAIAARGPERLVHLDLGTNRIGSRGVAALAASTRLGHLTHLGLAGVIELGLKPVVFRPLFETPNLPRLAALDLRRVGVTADDALALAASPLSERLYRLDLRHNRLGDQGVQALLEADWPRLAWLDVRDNGLSAGARLALRRRFGYSVHY
jgi:hypothetical protein